MRVDGRPGIYSLSVDTTGRRVLASSVGRLAARQPAVAQLSMFDADETTAPVRDLNPSSS